MSRGRARGIAPMPVLARRIWDAAGAADLRAAVCFWEGCFLKTMCVLPFWGAALRRGALALVPIFALIAAPHARALEVDFDVAMIVLDNYIAQVGLSTRLIGNDNDANGIKEEDQLGMLSAILSGGSGVSCISSSRVTEITNGFNSNFPKVKTELTVSISGYGTVDIISQLSGSNAQLGAALQNTITGFLTIADTATITFVNKLADDLATAYLTSINQSGQVNSVKNQINFLASDYKTFGNAPSEPNYLGPAGDIENDGQTNLAEYTVGAVPKGRELWLADCCITAPLRIVTVTGGGLKLSGLSDVYSVTAAGGNSNKSYSWRKGTTTSYTTLSSSPTYTINFLTTSSSGTYFCVVNDGTTTRTTPLLTLSVTYVPLYLSQQPQSVTRNAGSSHTFSVTAAGGAGPGPYQYSWRRGTTIVGTNAPTLTLNNISAANAGTYTVRVTSNGGGDTITSQGAVLTVNSGAFTIAQQPVGGRRYVGESIALDVGVGGGSGNFQYVWTRSGTTVSTSSSSALNLSNLGLINAGNYRCTVTDLNTSAQLNSDTVAVEVADALQITGQPESAEVNVAQPFSFTTVAQGGFAPLSYQWKWENLSIPGETSSTYAATAYSGFGGQYTCLVTDANGTTALSAPAELVVNASVQIIQDPQGGDYYVGGTAVLSVSATAGSIYTYNWLKDGVSLGLPSTSILSLGNLAVGDEGTYSVIVSKTGLGSATSAGALLRVRALPSFSTPPISKSAYTGSDTTFTVVATGGYLPYQYQWRKGTTAIGQATSSTLTLQNVNAGSQGNYNCVVTDDKGNQATSTSGTLTVVNHMAITTQPQSADVYTGASLNLSVVVTGGIPPLVYNWKRNGNSFDAPNAAQISFSPIDLGAAGSYTCEITDGGGEKKTSNAAIVNVADDLSITLQPEYKMLFEGELLSLSVTAAGGFPPLQYAWFRNDQPISGGTSPNFNVASVTQTEEGYYYCAVRDRLNRVITSDSVNVEVAEPLVVDLDATSDRLYAGSTFEITAIVLSGEGNYYFEWRKNGEAFGAPDSPTLVLNNVQPGNSGGYSCLVRDNTARGAVTPVHALEVQAQPMLLGQPAGDTAAVGTPVELSVVVSGGFVPLQFVWDRDGTPVSAAGVNDTDVLLFPAISETDAGTYRCTVTDALGTILISDPAQIAVVPALAIVSAPTSKQAFEGQAVGFSIVVTGGVPNLTISWYRGESLITVGNTLSFPSVETGDFGIYRCVVRDADGNTVETDPFTLSATGEVSIIAQPASAKRYLGESATFAVEAIGGTGTLSYTWKRDGEQVGTDTPVVTIDAVGVSDIGSYTCTVSDGTNEVVTDTAELSAAEALAVDAETKTAYPFATTDIGVAVSASGGFEPYTYSWQRDEVPVGTDGPSLELSDLDVDDTGDYTCTVRDGYGEVTVTVLVLRVQPVPSRHAADKDGDGKIALTELLRIIQFYTVGSYHCEAGTEDDFAPGLGDIESCLPHSADYEPINWIVSLSELLRLIQFYNLGGYYPCLGVGEDGYCAGPMPEGEIPAEGEGTPPAEGEGIAAG